MSSATPTELSADVATSHHRVRRTFSTFLGGIGVTLLGLGLIASVLMSFVSSPTAAKSTVENTLKQPEVQNFLVTEIVNELEEKANSVQKLVLIFAHNKIVTAIQKVLAEPEIQSSIGDAAAKAYSVYVDDEPTAEIDISPISKAVVAAVIGTDKRLKLAENLELDPVKITRDDNDFDFGLLRDSLRLGSWSLILIGLMMQVGAWFLSIASQWQRLLRLGIRFFTVGVVFLGIVLVARSKVPQSFDDNKAAIEAVAQLITDPMVTRFIVLSIFGAITGALGFIMNRKTTPTVS